jgi:hypothetical protein
MKRFAVLPAALVLAVGAAAPAGTQPTTGLKGNVWRGPVSPVCRIDTPCYVPYNGRLIFTPFRLTVPVKAIRTTIKGLYTASLSPGRYRVTTRSGPKFVGRNVEPEVVLVPKAGTRRVDFVVDTGIR